MRVLILALTMVFTFQALADDLHKDIDHPVVEAMSEAGLPNEVIDKFSRVMTLAASMHAYLESQAMLDRWRRWSLTIEGQKAISQHLENTSPYMPDDLAIPFNYESEIEVNGPIVESVEFTPHRCNLTLRNKTGQKSGVDIQVIVTNRSGVVLWEGNETWMMTRLDIEEKHLSSLSMILVMPPALRYSSQRTAFDLEPAWFIIIDKEHD